MSSITVGGIPKRKYLNIHQNLRRKNGKATKCESKSCTHQNPKRFEWALKKGKEYSENIKDYLQLCSSCHRKYDETDERRSKLSKIHKGKHYHNRDRKVNQFDLNGNLITTFDTIISASIATRVYPTGISNCLAKRQKSAGNFIWEYYGKNQKPGKYTKPLHHLY